MPSGENGDMVTGQAARHHADVRRRNIHQASTFSVEDPFPPVTSSKTVDYLADNDRVEAQSPWLLTQFANCYASQTYRQEQKSDLEMADQPDSKLQVHRSPVELCDELSEILGGSQDDKFQKEVDEFMLGHNMRRKQAINAVRARRLLKEHGKAAVKVMVDRARQWTENDMGTRGRRKSLHQAEIHTKRRLAQSEVKVLLDNMIDAGLDIVHIGAVSGESNAMHSAAAANYYLILEMLIEHGMDGIGMKDELGELPLEKLLRTPSKEYDNTSELLIKNMTRGTVRRLFTATTEWRTPPAVMGLDDDVLYIAKPAKYNFYEMLCAESDCLMPKTREAILECVVSSMSATSTTFDFTLLESDTHARPPLTLEYDPTHLVHHTLLCDDQLRRHFSSRVLLHHKWRSYGQSLAQRRILPYFLLVFALTYALIGGAVQRTSGFGRSNGTAYGSPLVYDTTAACWRAGCEVTVVLYACYTLFVQTQKIMHKGKRYLNFLWKDWAKLFSAILIFSLVVLRIVNTDAQWYLASFLYVVMVIRMLEDISVYPAFGTYMHILVRMIVRDVTKFTILYCIFLLAVGGSLYLALVAARSNTLPTGTELDVNPLVLGSFSAVFYTAFRTLVGSGLSEVNYVEGYNHMAVMLIMGFLYTSSVFLSSMLVAQLTDSYQEVKDDAQLTLEQTWSWYLMASENTDTTETLSRTLGNGSALAWFVKRPKWLGWFTRQRLSRLQHWKPNLTISDEKLREWLGDWERPASRSKKWQDRVHHQTQETHAADLMNLVKRQLEVQERQQARLDSISASLKLDQSPAPHTPQPSQ